MSYAGTHFTSDSLEVKKHLLCKSEVRELREKFTMSPLQHRCVQLVRLLLLAPLPLSFNVLAFIKRFLSLYQISDNGDS